MCEQPPLFIEHSLIPVRDIQIINDKGGLLVVMWNNIKKTPSENFPYLSGRQELAPQSVKVTLWVGSHHHVTFSLFIIPNEHCGIVWTES